MKFIHIADVHLGAEPEGLRTGCKSRGKEIWGTIERVIQVCEWEEIDLLLIAGDLFHRQPLLRELKELNYLFSKLTRTKVVFIAGNHDYLKQDSYYHTFLWNENVYPLLNGHMGNIEFSELETTVYGFSYLQKEILEPRYDRMLAPGKTRYEILLAHGGDERHIPLKKQNLEQLGYDYIALGHIHKPQSLIENLARYAGALEPIDKNDTGKHGYVRGEITAQGTKTFFVPFARREYVHSEIWVDEETTNGMIKDQICECIQSQGLEHIYKFTLKGGRDLDFLPELEQFRNLGNILEIVDETEPAIRLDRLLEQNRGNILGRYIESFEGCEKGSVEEQALFEGVTALLQMKRS